jgi:small subunit ribosomal protein S1
MLTLVSQHSCLVLKLTCVQFATWMATLAKNINSKLLNLTKNVETSFFLVEHCLKKSARVLRTQTLDQIKEGSIVTGIVKNITDYGAFIDLGGMDGLLHITDMSWGRVKHPSEVLGVGDEIQVKVLKYDNEKERVSLGMKQMQPDPWEQ